MPDAAPDGDTTVASSAAAPRRSLGRSLVLAGGGMRVAYQAGVIKALAEAGITFDHADGTSGGIINLAMLLSGRTPDDMCERWRTLEQRRFVSLPSLSELVHGPDMLGWGDADGITGYVFPHLGVDVGAIRAQRGITGTFNVCNFSDKTVETVTHDAVDLDLLVAGISLPVLMPPVRRGGAWYTDAVWIMDANVAEAARRGADEIWLVWCIGNTPEYHRGAFRQYVHMIEMAANGSLFGQFDRVRELRARDGARLPTLHVIKPELPLPLDPDYYLGNVSGGTLVEMGYADAWRYLRTMRPDGVPLTPEATRMRTSRPGITFNETMSGPFALGVTDPSAACDATDHAELAIHVTVHVDDVDAFVDDPQHPGRLTGRVEFAPFGRSLVATHGVFNLFSPTDDPGLTHMVYELGFRHDGTEYYLAGHKSVRNDAGLDLWSDTTTLYTTLHEGRDRAGPVIGAGVLRLGVVELASLVRSMRATNADGVTEQAKVVATFGRFFLRQLWATYDPLRSVAAAPRA